MGRARIQLLRFGCCGVLTAVVLSLLAGTVWGGPQDSGVGAVAIVQPLVGSTIPEVVARLGRPYSVIPLRETGGKLMFFENLRGDRFILETDVSNHVIDAAVKHPER